MAEEDGAEQEMAAAASPEESPGDKFETEGGSASAASSSGLANGDGGGGATPEDGSPPVVADSGSEPDAAEVASSPDDGSGSEEPASYEKMKAYFDDDDDDDDDEVEGEEVEDGEPTDGGGAAPAPVTDDEANGGDNEDVADGEIGDNDSGSDDADEEGEGDGDSNSDSDSEGEPAPVDPAREAAQHMAAVAAAANASLSESPSAAADYARRLAPGVVPAATIAALPPPVPAGTGGPTRAVIPPEEAREERRRPVRVTLVRKALQRRFEREDEEWRRSGEGDGDGAEEAGSAAEAAANEARDEADDNEVDGSNSDDESEQASAAGEETAESTPAGEGSASSEPATTVAPASESATESDDRSGAGFVAAALEPANDSMVAIAVGGALSKDAAAEKGAVEDAVGSALRSRLAAGYLDSFLSQLLWLSGIPVSDEDDGVRSRSGSFTGSMASDAALKAAEKAEKEEEDAPVEVIIRESDGDDEEEEGAEEAEDGAEDALAEDKGAATKSGAETADEAAEREAEEERKKDLEAAEEAAAEVANLLRRVEASYDALTVKLPKVPEPAPQPVPSSLVPPSLAPTESSDDSEEGGSTTSSDDGASSSFSICSASFGADYNTQHRTVDILPDLLPPCSSPRGDATAAFFRACSPRRTLPPEGLGASDGAPGGPVSPPTSPPTSPQRNASAPVGAKATAASVLGSFVQSIGGGNKSRTASPPSRGWSSGDAGPPKVGAGGGEGESVAAAASTKGEGQQAQQQPHILALGERMFGKRRAHHHQHHQPAGQRKERQRSWRALLPRDDDHAKAASAAAAASSEDDKEKDKKDEGTDEKGGKDGSKDEKDEEKDSATAATGDDNSSTVTESTAATSTTVLATVQEGTSPKAEAEEGADNRAEEPPPPPKGECAAGPDYLVSIEREMLGLTVENVLERTVVRTVLPGGAAGRAGAKVGSLIVRVGTVDTANLTHFETIDELRQSQRPLKLVLRRIGKDALRGAREEMGRLIRGGGFGGDAPPVLSGPAPPPAASMSSLSKGGGGIRDGEEKVSGEDGAPTTAAVPSPAKKPTEAETKELSRDFVRSLHARWSEGTRRACRGTFTKRDDALSRAGERLVWVLTLLVAGLEREAVRLAAQGDTSLEEYDAEEREKTMGGKGGLGSPESPKGRRGSGSSYGTAGSSSSSGSRHHHHRHADECMNARECVEAAKSVSKVLTDYVKRHVERREVPAAGAQGAQQKGQRKPNAAMPPTGPGGQHVPMSKQLAMRKQQRAAAAAAAAGGPAAGAGKPGAPQATGANANAAAASGGPLAAQSPFESSLHAVGDVLHRTRTFLADPSSPPAALLRGEVISLLCDVLDVDAEMHLNEEEAASSVAGGRAAPINELGSAGSLLKLIVLNCSMMRSPGCTGSAPPSSEDKRGKDDDEEAIAAAAAAASGTVVEPKKANDDEDEHSAHAGNRFLAVVHRLAASKSTSARVTACSLGPVLWAHLDFPHQLQLRGVITRALHDVEVIVRKSTATVLHEIAELVFDSRAVPWLVLMCERAMTDPEPQLRSAAMTLTWHLAEHLPNAFYGDARGGSRSLRRLPPRTDPTFMDVYLLQCKLLPVATRLAEDRAPPVRLAVAAQCDRLCNALGEHWFSVIIDLLQSLLGDADERVRAEATLCIPRLVDSVLSGTMSSTSPGASVNVLESILPVAIKLLKDPSAGVRVSLATASGELLTLLVGLQTTEELVASSNSMTSIASASSSDGATGAGGSSASDTGTGFQRYKKHIDEKLIPLVQRLLHDTDPEVTSAALRAVTNASRGNVREISSRRPSHAGGPNDDEASVASHVSMASVEKKEPVFIPVLSERQVLRLLPTLSDLATSAQWRVRQSAVEIVPALLGCTHRLETRSEIAQLCVKLMGDNVDAVRKTAAECLCLGGGSLGSHGEDDGSEWISAIVVPHLRTCSKSENSKQRMLSLKMVEVIVVNGVCCSGTKASLTRSVPSLDDVSGDRPASPLRTVVEIAASLSSDRVVNVRLNVGRVFGSIINMLEEEELKYIVTVLEEQIEEERQRDGGSDRDVLYFAARAASSARTRLEDLTLDASMAQLDTSVSN